jgi:hypothetical protein
MGQPFPARRSSMSCSMSASCHLPIGQRSRQRSIASRASSKGCRTNDHE